MIGYTCKYTPVELLAALGGQPALLNREAAAFSHAEALTHNHLCCHAKAVLEECRRDGVRELVLVNCCDSIRRCYDVLRAQGGLDFLFLLDLPHHDDGCAKARLRGELERLAAEYGAYRGATLDEAALRAAFAPPVPLPDGPFLAVTGARAGAGLLRQPEPAAPAGGAGRSGRSAGLVHRRPAGADSLPAHGRGGPPGGAAEPPRPQGPGVPHRQVLRLLLLRVREPAQAHRPAPAQGGDRLHPPVQRAALHPAGGLSGGAGAPPRPCFRRPAGGLCGGHRQRLHHHQRGGARPGGERGRLRHRPHRPKGQPGRGEGLRRPGRLHPGGHGRHRGHRLRPEQHPLRHRAGDRDHLPRPGGTACTRRPGPSWTSAARTARSSVWTSRAA